MKFRMSLSSVLVVVCLLLGGLPVTAAPSLLGPTGLLLTPTADALDEKDYNVAAFALNLEEGADANVYLANLGLADGLEVGFARHDPEGAAGETYLNAKYTFSRETDANPAIAAGVLDFTGEVDATTYIVASKALQSRYETGWGDLNSPRIHFGVGGGQLDGLFGGFSVALGDRLLLMVEHDTSDVNFGARFALSDTLRIHAGALGSLDDIGLGISFNKLF